MLSRSLRRGLGWELRHATAEPIEGDGGDQRSEKPHEPQKKAQKRLRRITRQVNEAEAGMAK